MLQWPRARPRHSGAAFTLIELILVVALVSLLLGAVAFNFGALSRGQSLEEGASQFEALLRLSRANAAATGRPVLLALLAATNAAPSSEATSGGSPAALSLAVLSQPDPLRQPDLYQTLPSTQYLLTQLADLIRLEIPLPPKNPDQSDPSDPSDPSSPSSTTTPFTPILTFNPDGSSDAADFILLPQDPEDRRRIHIHVDAITGTLHRRYLSADPGRPDNELPSEDEFPEEEESMEPDPAFITADPNGTSPATEAAKPSKPSRAP